MKWRIPTEGNYTEVEGDVTNIINVSLYVVDGFMRSLEIIRMGGDPRRLPKPEDLELFTPYGEFGVWSTKAG